jgi:hypothetical protein
MVNSGTGSRFALVCLLALLVAPLAVSGGELSTAATASAVAAPSANDVVIQQLLEEGEVTPLPGLTPKPVPRLKACEYYHFEVTTCSQCTSFCAQIENCYGVCSHPVPGCNWCDCTLGEN